MESTPVEHRHDAPGARAGVAVDLAALLDSLRTEQPGEGYTVAEISERMGWNTDRTRREIKRLLASGRGRATRKAVQAMDGRIMQVPSYVFEVPA